MTDYKKLGKKICAYAVCAAMTVSLAGCGANSEAVSYTHLTLPTIA